MKKVSTVELPVNSYIDQPVYLDEKYILLTPDIPVHKELKDRLKTWKFDKVLTDGTPVSTPERSRDAGNSENEFLSANLQDEEESEEIRRFYRSTVKFLSELFTVFSERNVLRIEALTDKVKEIMATVKSQRSQALRLVTNGVDTSNYLVEHSVKTTILALAIADFFHLPPHKQIELGNAAMLHKLGMLKIPSRLYLSDKPLSPQERKTISAHPILSYKVLKEAGFPVSVAVGVLEQGERIDGTGSPRNLTGDKISLYGKILSVATSYTAAISNRPFRAGLDSHSGIVDLLKSMGTKYEESVIKALVYLLSIYPLGTYVELTDGSKGVVVQTSHEDPKHPAVKLLMNQDGYPYMQQPVLQTRQGEKVQVKRSLGEAEKQELLKSIS